MTSLYLACALVGAAVLILQIAFGFLEFDAGHEAGGLHIGDATFAEGLDLFSVRSVAAGAAAFGLGGLFAISLALPVVVGLALAIGAGAAGMYGTAFLMRQMLRLESDGSLQIAGSIGRPATVYIPIPPAQGGQGKVQLTLQGRTVELAAVTNARGALATGTPVIVVSVIDSETVEVLPASTIQEVLDANG
jgi:hypothetical protein